MGELGRRRGRHGRTLRVDVARSGGEAQRGALMAGCSAEAKSARSKGQSPDAWFEGYLKGFLDNARLQLNPEEQSQLDEALRRLRLRS